MKLKPMSRFRSYLVAGFCGLTLLYFNNCQTYSENNLFDYQPECLESCGDPNRNLLALTITTMPQPLQIERTTTSVFLDGRCNNGGFPDNYIVVTVKDISGNILSVDQQRGACPSDQSLYFHIQVNIPGNFAASSITLDLIGLDEGQPVNRQGELGNAQKVIYLEQKIN